MWPQWRQDLHRWRDEARRAQGYDGKPYDDPAYEWVQRAFCVAKVMLFDREWVDPARSEFKVEAWLDRMDRDFGGIDALVLWQAYPRIGVDQRNQFDHYRGVPGLAQVVDRIHRRGIKTVLAYNPWDTGTRREGKPDEAVLVDMVEEFGFDGVFLDTLRDGGRTLRPALDRAKPGVVLESELDLPVTAIKDHHASWAQWFGDSEAPGVMRNKWFEPRHMMHTVRRWDRDHTGETQMAWMNGTGQLVWENVFGTWNGWSERDKSVLRSVREIQKRYWKHLSRGKWTPLVETHGEGFYASRWELDGISLWTAVNRSDKPVDGIVEHVASDGARRLFDLVRGEEVDHGHLALAPRWVGCLASVPSRLVDEDFRRFLASQAERHARATFVPRRVERLPSRVPAPESRPVPQAPPGFVLVAGGGRDLESVVRVRECGDYEPGRFADVAYPGLHSDKPVVRHVRLRRFALAEREVTNREYDAFCAATGRPNPAPGADPSGAIVGVSLADARAYAAWKGWRLPTEDEWQVGVLEHRLPHGQVWNWTESEHEDGRTTFSFLKGGCAWRAVGSDWYVETGPMAPQRSVKLIHFWPEMDRSATIGFRCAVDVD
ncbi:MAG: SUMF1/EgtB/PvdO family nonheme iron enzyme [Fimbriimonadaceae bacterium]|nr:SUMF1/EgtB/PvdO family nonheme iron enzyme [Fimbriimonadaceae bacterium]